MITRSLINVASVNWAPTQLLHAPSWKKLELRTFDGGREHERFVYVDNVKIAEVRGTLTDNSVNIEEWNVERGEWVKLPGWTLVQVLPGMSIYVHVNDCIYTVYY